MVDNTSYWRMHDDVPLVVAGVNDEAADAHGGIVANPNCTTMQMVVALKPIWDEVGIERIVSTYQSVSGTGRRAIELREQSRAVLQGDQVDPEVFPHQVAFNVIPQVEAFTEGDDYATEERKVMNETRKILGAAEARDLLDLCPSPRRHRALRVGQRRDSRGSLPEGCRELLAGFPGIVVVDAPHEGSTRWRSTPRAATRCSWGGSAGTPRTSGA